MRTSTLSSTQQDRLPWPIGHYWVLALQARSLDDVYCAAEGVMRGITALLLADVLDTEWNTELDALLRGGKQRSGLEKLSLGTRLRILRAIVNTHRTAADPVLPSLDAWWNAANGPLNALIEARNQSAHRTVSFGAAKADRARREAVDLLAAVLRPAACLREVQVLHVEGDAVRIHRDQQEGAIRRLAGTNPYWSGLPAEATWPTAFVLQHNLVYIGTADGRRWKLLPFVRLQPGNPFPRPTVLDSVDTQGDMRFVDPDCKDEGKGHVSAKMPDRNWDPVDWFSFLEERTTTARTWRRQLEDPHTAFRFEPPAQLADGPREGTVLDGMRFVRKLGEGGAAVVWEVELTKFQDRRHALKVLKPEITESELDARRFEYEVDTMTRLFRNGCRRVLGPVEARHVTDGEERRLVALMPLMAATLKETAAQRRVASGGQPPDEATIQDWLRQGLEALVELHAHGVVHRDIKPSNFLLDAEGRMFVADLGVAWDNRRKEALTGTGDAPGTDIYMAPEQRTGRREDIGPAVDVYALAVSIDELLHGQARPVAGKGVPGVIGELLRAMGHAEADQRPSAQAALARLDAHANRERDAHEHAEREARERAAREEAERTARAYAERLAREHVERLAREHAERLAQEHVERLARELDEREARARAERDAREQAEREARARAEREAREEAERLAREYAERLAREHVERLAREHAERLAQEHVERLARELDEREARARAEREERARAEREAWEARQREARERAEQEAREQAKRLAREEAERAAWEARQRAARERELREGREAQERAAREAQEARQREARERAEQEAREQARRLAREEAERAAWEARQRAEHERALREGREAQERAAQERAAREAWEARQRAEHERALREGREAQERAARERAARAGTSAGMAGSGAHHAAGTAKPWQVHHTVTGTVTGDVVTSTGLFGIGRTVERRQWDSTERFDMVVIPPRTFQMGSPPSEPGRDGSEYRHGVVLTRTFAIATTPVTQALWRTVMGSYVLSGATDPHANVPITEITWYEALTFCNRLSAMQGLQRVYDIGEGERPRVRVSADADGFRLPTEAEWECAARADGSFLYAGSNDAAAVACFAESADERVEPGPVKQKQPNAWGLYDMSGLVWEWVRDADGPYPTETVTDPKGSAGGTARIVRGGSFAEPAANVRVAVRRGADPAERYSTIGVRVARSVR